MAVELRILKACNGDCIWLRYGKSGLYSNIIIDSGPKTFARHFRDLINKIRASNEHVDLLVITHIDDDHLGGFSKWISDSRNDTSVIKKLWFNTGNIIKDLLKITEFENKEFPVYFHGSETQYTIGLGKEATQHLIERGIKIEPGILLGHIENINGATLTVISPSEKKLKNFLLEWDTKPDKGNTAYASPTTDTIDLNKLPKSKSSADTNPFNGSSIAFIFEYDGISLAFLADAHVQTLMDGIKQCFKSKPLTVNMIKLSHHGSSSNTNVKLLKRIKTSNYVLSTNGSNNKPDKKTIARIVSVNEGIPVKIFSNYDWWSSRNMFTNTDYETYIAPNLLETIKLTSNLVLVSEGLVIGND